MRFRFVFLTVGLGFASPTGFAAQHDHPGQAHTATAQVARCSQAQSVVTGLVAAALKRVEAARLTNNATAMRDAVDDLESVLIDIREQLSPCSQLATSAAVGHAGHTMPNVEPGPASTPGISPARPGSPAPAPGAVAPPAPAGIDPHARHISVPAPRETTPPGAIIGGEPTVARRLRAFAVPGEYAKLRNPVLSNDESVRNGMAHFADTAAELSATHGH